MKILYIVDARIPTEKAHGYQIIKTCEALAAQGMDVELIVPTTINPITADVFDFYSASHNFSVVYLKMPRLPRSWLFPFSFIPYYASLLFFAYAARHYVRTRTYERFVVYTRTGAIVPLLALYAPVIYESHGFSRISSIIRCRYAAAVHIIAITEGIRAILIRRGVSSARITVIPDGVDYKAFKNLPACGECRAVCGIKALEKVVGYVGRFTVFNKEKGVATLIRAMGILKKQGVSARLLLVGGPHTVIPKYMSIADACGFGADSIIYMPQVPVRDVGVCMRACDALVIPLPRNTFSALYTSPLKMFEYMASGIPIIASDLPSLREILNEKNAFFAAPDEPQDFALAIAAALDSNGDGGNRAAQALSDVERYSWDSRARRIRDCIARSLGAGYDTP